MPYEIIDEGVGLSFWFRGDISIKEIMAANTVGWEHSGRQTHGYQIWNFSNVATLIADEVDAVLIAKMDNVAFSNAKVMKTAFVANNEHIIDLFETYVASIDAESMEARVFDEEATAREWLNE